MFCKNCGSVLAEGAKFCSECGTKVEIEAAINHEAISEEVRGADEAFKERVSFDWSNVIDEPQKKEVPQEIKSPWAAATDAIDERAIYEEMTQSDDKNRTMSFIDVLKADKEERERAALDRSIEYTEVLELDPELLGGTKPPSMHVPPLYEDLDEPVKTPFDDVKNTSSFDTGYFEKAEIDTEPELEIPAVEPVSEPQLGAGKFELPDFLKKAVGFGAANEAVERIEKEDEVEEPIFNEEPVVETAAVEETVAEETHIIGEAPVLNLEDLVVEEEPTETAEAIVDESTDTEDFYLDEDLYLDLEEAPTHAARMSRVDAHTLAGDYDFFEEDEEDDEEEPEVEEPSFEEPEEETESTIDENELFTEMAETPGSRASGMTIAAPADEEAEIEALKRRLAELTGTVEIDPAELEAVEPVVETPVVEEPVVEEPVFEAPVVEEPVIEEPKFEDFTFEPEVTAADDAFFDGLTPANDMTVSEKSFGLPVEEEYDDFTFEPEVTAADDELFANLTPAHEITTPEPVIEETVVEEPVVEEPVFEAPVVEEVVAPAAAVAAGSIDFEPPTPIISEEQKDAFSSLNFDIPSEPVVEEPVVEEPVVEEPVFEAPVVEEPVAEEPVFEPFEAEANVEEDSPIVGFAPAVTEVEPVVTEPEPVFEPVVEPVVAEPVVEEPVVEAPKVAKTSDALSLEELERDLFGAVEEGAEPDIETKKIDKFYTLYRKNEEFQRLLDEEYSRLKGEHIVIPEDDEVVTLEETAELGDEEIPTPVAEAVTTEPEAAPFALEDFITEQDSRPVEDATIYQEMPKEITEAIAQAEATETPQEPKFGLGGVDVTETAATAAVAEAEGNAVGTAAAVAGAVAAAGAVAGAADKADAKVDAKAAKEEARAAKKAAKEARKAEKAAAKAAATADPQVEYENVDGGSTILTILAVIVAILLVVLLAVILILHLAPDSDLAMTIDQFIENLTSKFGAIQTYRGMRVL